MTRGDVTADFRSLVTRCCAARLPRREPIDAAKLIGTNAVRSWFILTSRGLTHTPKPGDVRHRPEAAPVRPPSLPPDFPDIARNPSSELQPPPDGSRRPTRLRARRPLRQDPKRCDA